MMVFHPFVMLVFEYFIEKESCFYRLFFLLIKRVKGSSGGEKRKADIIYARLNKI